LGVSILSFRATCIDSGVVGAPLGVPEHPLGAPSGATKGIDSGVIGAPSGIPGAPLGAPENPLGRAHNTLLIHYTHCPTNPPGFLRKPIKK